MLIAHIKYVFVIVSLFPFDDVIMAYTCWHHQKRQKLISPLTDQLNMMSILLNNHKALQLQCTTAVLRVNLVHLYPVKCFHITESFATSFVQKIDMIKDLKLILWSIKISRYLILLLWILVEFGFSAWVFDNHYGTPDHLSEIWTIT